MGCMFVVVAGSLRVLLPCVCVGAFVCAYLMLTLIWTVGSHFFSLIRDVLQNEKCNFRKGQGKRCEKNGACSRISTRKFVWTAFDANKFFVSRSEFREVNRVVQLVQNGGSVGSFRSTGFASIFFSHRDLDFDDVQLSFGLR